MEKYFFMKPVLQLISVGHFFRKAFAVFLQILAVVIAIAGLVAWIGVWRSISGPDACDNRLSSMPSNPQSS